MFADAVLDAKIDGSGHSRSPASRTSDSRQRSSCPKGTWRTCRTCRRRTRCSSVEGDDLLRPTALRPLAYFDDDLLTIQKYSGKTNEQFTKLLLNVTVLASSFAPQMLDRRLVVWIRSAAVARRSTRP